MNAEQIIKKVVNYATLKIVNLADTNLTNAAKKESLDLAVENYIKDIVNAVTPNFIIRWVVNKFLLPNIPVLTQQIFDLLKAKIYGITKEV